MNKVGIFFLALLFVFGGIMAMRYTLISVSRTADHGSATEPAAETTQQTDPSQWLTEFTLTDQQGQPFESKQLAGKVWVGSFFFSRCPSTCREQNMRVAELQREFADRGLQLVSISCEPDYDTPSRLLVYAQQFEADHEHWHFLTGELDYIMRVGAEMFQLTVSPQAHSDRIVIFDTEGNRVEALRTRDPKDFVQAKKILDQLLPAAAPAEVTASDA